MQSLKLISQVKSGDLSVLKNNKWLQFLYLTEQTNYNIERISSFNELNNHCVLNYVKKTLEVLNNIANVLDQNTIDVIEEVLIWSEVAKCGNQYQRKQWEKKGYNLNIHNTASANIYSEHRTDELCKDLIATHGLIGQYIRGEESNLNTHSVLLQYGDISKILYYLNYCIVSAVSPVLWENSKNEFQQIIAYIFENKCVPKKDFITRLSNLRKKSIKNGENFNSELSKTNDLTFLEEKFNNVNFWYIESALYDFNFTQFIQVLKLISNDINDELNVSLEPLMKQLYYDYNHTKKINIYKKRIIEKYLQNPSNNIHVKHKIIKEGKFLSFDFEFSNAGEKLIEFCVEAEKSGLEYDKAIIVLFDLFDLRKDQFDRFHNEESYLQTMNQSKDYKKVIVDYVVGDTIVDIGPGGGVLLDELESSLTNKNIYGIDISTNVIEKLNKKKELENHTWNVIQGNAFELKKYIDNVDTIIFCSIIHELFSYIELDNKKFNHDTIANVLKSAFDALNNNGRIIIRDGIMTDSKEKRIIRFKSDEGLDFLKQYVKDFKGRDIQFEITGLNEVKMDINDAMEFLYTYTWGEQSYTHEVQEQFGYFTPAQYENFIQTILGQTAKIITNQHYLQDGYNLHLNQKIEFFDCEYNSVVLPDSTCLIVIEKSE